MSELVPEQRTNVNGVTQRKWVRPHLAASPGAASIPTPAMGFAAASEDDVLREEARSTLLQLAEDLHWDEDEDTGDGEEKFADKVDEILPQIGGATAVAFAEVCDEITSSTADHLIADSVLVILHDPLLPDETKNTAVRNYLSIIPVLPEGEDEDGGIYTPLYALHVIGVLDRQDVANTFSPEQVEAYRQAVRALNGIADRHRSDSVRPGLTRDGNGFLRPTGPYTLHVLRKHHEKAAHIADALIERGSFDEDDALAIAEGGAVGKGNL